MIDIKPDHHFRYAREWDPRLPAHTKGGYLEGKIQLPRNSGDLRVVLTTVPASPLMLEEDVVTKHPTSVEVHPTILFVVRMGKGKRMQEKEPVPNAQQWQQEFYIVNKCVRIKNRVSNADLVRYDKIPVLPEVDDICMLGEDMVLHLGKRSTQLNLVIIIPKTQERSATEDLSIKKIISDRISDPQATKSIIKYFRKKALIESKKVKLKVEIFSLTSNLLLFSGFSATIFDKGSKHHQPLEFAYTFPLRSCSLGGRKVIMISESPIPKDVVPRFFLYNESGKRIEEKEFLLNQPSNSDVEEKQICVMKESVIFITPQQPNTELIMKNRWSIKLAAVRLSDGNESNPQSFDYVPDDYYQPCIFCELNPDNQEGKKATLPEPLEVSKTGKKKRTLPKMSNSDNITEPMITQNAHSNKVMRLDDSNSNHDYAKDASNDSSKSKEKESLCLDVEHDIPQLMVTKPIAPMPGLIKLDTLQHSSDLLSDVKVARGPLSPPTLIPKEEPVASIMLHPRDPYDLGIVPEVKQEVLSSPSSSLSSTLSSTATRNVSVIVKTELPREFSDLPKLTKQPRGSLYLLKQLETPLNLPYLSKLPTEPAQLLNLTKHPRDLGHFPILTKQLNNCTGVKSYPVNLKPVEETIVSPGVHNISRLFTGIREIG